MKFKHMFSPIQIGPMTVKNRFVVPPMGNNFANLDGTWSDESVAYYGERAKGQFGLITIEATVVHKGAKGGPKKPCLYDDNSIESLKKITDACHEEGAKVSIQLQNAGPEGNAKNAGAPIQAATAIASADGRDIPEEVSTEKVYELVKGYGEAAERAMKGGADAVEIHMAHGYLVNSFMSPRTNKRVDEFGGNFENRMRFSRLIIEEVKKKTEGNNKKTIENLIVFLILLVITIISINIIWGNDKKEEYKNPAQDDYRVLAQNTNESNISGNQEYNLEKKLEDILSKISGVGKVQVLITYSETSEVVAMHNEVTNKSRTEENDTNRRNKNNRNN